MATGNHWHSKQTAEDNGIKEYTVYDGQGRVVAGDLGFTGAQQIVHYANSHFLLLQTLKHVHNDPTLSDAARNLARNAIEEASQTPWERKQERGQGDEDIYRLFGIEFPVFYASDHGWCPQCGDRCDATVAQGQVIEFICTECGRLRNQEGERTLARIADRRRRTGR